jgi:RNase P subunit RPR2
MKSKETFNQIICEKCKGVLIPIYNQENKNFKIYCPNCDYAWRVPATILLTNGLCLYTEEEQETTDEE